MPHLDAYRLQVIETLKRRYFPMILSLPGNSDPDQIEKNRLSRSLAAFAIEKLADVTPTQAANAVVDAGNDNGIDSILFDQAKNILWIVQSKLSQAPDMGENKKFCDGVRDLISGRFTKFNRNFDRLKSDVEAALESSELMIIGCHIHLGNQPLGPHAVVDLNQLKDELNQFADRFNWQEANLAVTHKWLTDEQTITPVNVDSMVLRNWHGFQTPHCAYYGLIAAKDLATLYVKEGKKLFEKNIRHYLGDQGVNYAIAATVQNEPANLFYLNNGITAICSKITLLPSHTNKEGRFDLKSFSIVNGAQTVGSIARVQSTQGFISDEANILITLIEVGNSQPLIGENITRARNTQNTIRGLHFAALDPNQERLRRELELSEITYYYRPSLDAVLGGDSSISIDRAALALAALSGNTRVIVAAKKELGQLYDRNNEYYPQLFKPGLTGIHLCRTVRIFEYLNGILDASERAECEYDRRMFYRHGRFFICHILSRRNRTIIDRAEIVLSNQDKIDLSRAVTDMAELIWTTSETKIRSGKGYLAFFRNLSDSEFLARETMKALPTQSTQQEDGDGPNSPLAPPPTLESHINLV